MKTVRFSQVVERSGRPHVHSLWVAPERDAEFVRARKADRVMTVRPRAKGKSDIGVVGFEPGRQAATQLLIFPKSLRPFDGREVVGVKFDLVEQPETQNVTAPQDWKPPAKKHGRKSAGTYGRKSAAAEKPADVEPPTTDERPRSRHAAPERAEGVRDRHAPPRKAMRAAEARAARADSAGHADLLREVHAALKELRAGKTVAAYQRLERAAADAESAD